jgi:HEAT repeat protein
MSLLPKALSTIGHPQAQGALVEAIRAHSQDKTALFALINPLATVSEPTQQAEETLWNLAFNSRDPEITAMAQLALGAQARRLSATSPERVAKIVDRFIQEIKGSPSPQVTKQLLLALGNAGSSRALPEISKFVTNSSADLRAIALHALRFIDSPQAETLLLKALSSDQDSSVRIAAATSMGYREMTKSSFKAQAQIFSKDSNVTVRLKVLENLWKSHKTFPEARNLVKKAASEDRSEEIRKAARNIISQYPNIFKGTIT